MQDGLAQLIFILLIFFAAILDFLARSRNKRKRMDRMDTEEEAEEGRAGWEEGPPLEVEEPWEIGGSWEVEERRGPGEPGRPGGPPGREAGAGEEDSRRTADTMVPADLWEEILGGAPGTARRSEEPSRDASLGPMTRRESAPSEQPAAPARTGRTGTPADRATPRPRAGPPPPPPPPSPPSEKELMDRAKEEERRARLERARARKAKRPSTAEAGGLAELFRSGDPAALQRAVLYREILGRPLALRPGGSGGWEEEGER